MPIKKWLKYALSNYILQCTLRTISSAQGVKKAMIPRIKNVPDMLFSLHIVSRINEICNRIKFSLLNSILK